MTKAQARRRREALEQEVRAAAAASAEASRQIGQADAAVTAAEADLRNALTTEARGHDGAADQVSSLRAAVVEHQAAGREAKQRHEAANAGRVQASAELKQLLVEELTTFAADADQLADAADRDREKVIKALETAVASDQVARAAWGALSSATRNGQLAGVSLGAEPTRVLDEALAYVRQAKRPEPSKASEARKSGLLERAWRTYRRRDTGDTVRVRPGGPEEGAIISENNDLDWDLVRGEQPSKSTPEPKVGAGKSFEIGDAT